MMGLSCDHTRWNCHAIKRRALDGLRTMLHMWIHSMWTLVHSSEHMTSARVLLGAWFPFKAEQLDGCGLLSP